MENQNEQAKGRGILPEFLLNESKKQINELTEQNLMLRAYVAQLESKIKDYEGSEGGETPDGTNEVRE